MPKTKALRNGYSRQSGRKRIGNPGRNGHLRPYTAETGYLIEVQHNQDFVSVYKHCGSLLKREGDTVKGGEAIALIGNSGQLTTGPHLHFELWHKGRAVNPELYIVF
mgnify:CR=1 FL=1